MNKELSTKLNKLKELTNESFLYNIQTWFHGSTGTVRTEYVLSSSLTGFKQITKETEKELIDVLDLVEKQVYTLMEVKETQKQIDVKLIGSI